MDLPQLICYFQNLERDRRSEMEVVLNTSPNNLKYFCDFDSSEFMELVRSEKDRALPNPFLLAHDAFVKLFGVEKALAEEFLLDLRSRTYYNPEIDHNPLPYDIRVLWTLNYLVHGHMEHLRTTAAFKVYPTNALMRCVPQVCHDIVNFLSPTYVSFPHKDVELNRHKKYFAEKYGVSGVIGVMDCFTVRLSKVPDDLQCLYMNNNEVCINVQVICDHNYRFLDANPRFPGGKKDIYIWKRSHIRDIMKHLYEKDTATWLIADRSYHLEKFLINPYRNPQTQHDKTVNLAIMDVLNVVDHAKEILKSRFSCLDKVLPFTHEECADIVTSCVTLHNYIMGKGYNMLSNLNVQFAKRLDLPNAQNEDDSTEGRSNRELIKYILLNY